MAAHLRPTAPSREADRLFEQMRQRTLEEASKDRCGRLLQEAVSLDGSTLILCFASGARREVRMPSVDELSHSKGDQRKCLTR